VPAQFGVLEQTMVESHIPFPHANALFVSTVEFACGAGLALGLLTPLCVAMLAGNMIVAIATNRIHSIQASGFLAWLDDLSLFLFHGNTFAGRSPVAGGSRPTRLTLGLHSH
jgi:uncharacterized membrane protein YphA (DoxX/SURF4 family)